MANLNHETHSNDDNGVLLSRRKLGHIPSRSVVFSTTAARPAMATWLLVLATLVLLSPTASAYYYNQQRELSQVMDPLRKFIGDAIMRVPDYVETQETWLGTLNISLTDFLCFDATYGNITMDLIPSQSQQQQQQQQQQQNGPKAFRLEVTDMMFQCTMNVTWTYGNHGNQNGAGNASLVSDKNYLTAIVSTDTLATTNDTSCQGTVIDIDTLEFDGDLSLQVMNLYR